jgi:hypothetical protein
MEPLWEKEDAKGFSIYRMLSAVLKIFLKN